MKYIDLTNQVLQLLREPQITSGSFANASDYQKLVGQFVNLAVKEVEDSWQWSSLVAKFRADILKDVTNQVAGITFVDSTQRERIRFLSVKGLNTNSNYYSVKIVPYDELLKLVNRATPVPTSTTISHWSYRIDPTDPATILYANYPQPTLDIQVDLYYSIPSPILTQDTNPNSGENYEIKAPFLPVLYNAYLKCIAERGEDGSISAQEALRSYHTFLADAIVYDQQFSSKNLIWNVE